jgi:CBS domain-containing protein
MGATILGATRKLGWIPPRTRAVQDRVRKAGATVLGEGISRIPGGARRVREGAARAGATLLDVTRGVPGIPRAARSVRDRVVKVGAALQKAPQRFYGEKGREMAVKVGDLMTRDVKVCHAWDPLSWAVQTMWEHDCGVVPVIAEEGRVIGMITDRDVCMAVHFRGEAPSQMRVEEAMSREVHFCQEHDNLVDVEEVMRERQVRRLPVVDDEGGIVGLISLRDLVLAAAESTGRRAKGLTLQAVARTMAGICEKRERSGQKEALLATH